MSDFKKQVEDLQSTYNISHNVSALLNECASQFPGKLFEAAVKRVCGVSNQKEYDPVIRKFALTLQLISIVILVFRLILMLFLQLIAIFLHLLACGFDPSDRGCGQRSQKRKDET